MENPLLRDDPLPAFEAIRPEHVQPAIRTLLEGHRARLRELAAQPQPTFASVVEPVEDLQHRLTRTWSPIGNLNAVMNSEALRTEYNACLPLLSEYATDLGQSEPLYRAYLEVHEREGVHLDVAQRAVVDHALRDFRLAGVALPAERKNRFKEVMLELSRLTAKFEENVLDATNAFAYHTTDAAEVDGISPMVLGPAQDRAKAEGKPGWVFGLQQPTYVAIVTNAHSVALRRRFYEAWSTRASDRGPGEAKFDNTQVMQDILRLRKELAELLEFKSYAHYALATRMAKSVDDVLKFLRELATAARPAAQREFAELEAFAGRKLDAWDITYYSERLQQQRFSISQEELRDYLSLPRVMAALFEVIERLFRVTLRERKDVSVWHPDVRYFEILRAGDGQLSPAPIGGFYLDVYARASKRSGAWMDECVGRKTTASGTALPVAYLVCNALPPVGDKPALLTHNDVVTLFHEFGHGLHHLLTRIGYPSIAGINGVSWDAVELPSQFMENYAWHPEVLARIAKHVTTGEPLSAEKQRQLIATRSFQAGLATLRQVEFALFDFRLHAEFDGGGTPLRALLDEVRAEVAVIRIPEWNRYPNSFAHIFSGGYAAGYYSYKWAEVLAADSFEAFTEHGAFDAATAQRFLDSILSRGGSRDALEAFVEFRGRPPDIMPLLRLHGIAA